MKSEHVAGYRPVRMPYLPVLALATAPEDFYASVPAAMLRVFQSWS